MVVKLIVIFAAVWLAAAPAMAWGPRGHRIVAMLAQAQLSVEASEQVRELLAEDAASQLSDIADWADTVRATRTRRETAKWHYLNFQPGNCRYSALKLCSDGHCLVAAAERELAALADRRQSKARRSEALKWVVHLIADLHQPLHLGFAADKGGNLFQVQVEGKGSNWHQVWDSGLLATRNLSSTRYARALAQLPNLKGAPIPFSSLAESACELVQSPGFYPKTRRISDAELVARRPLAELQLRKAGAQLAAWLNRALAAPPGGKRAQVDSAFLPPA